MKENFYNYIRDNFSIDFVGMKLIWNILDYAYEQTMDKEDTVMFLMDMFDGIGIENEEIERFINWG